MKDEKRKIRREYFLTLALSYFDLHIGANELTLDIPALNNEPIVTSLALYNVGTMEKISSDFVFFADSLSTITSVQFLWFLTYNSKHSETCVVPVKERRDEYYAVVVLSKEMQEDQSSLLDLYAKMKVRKGEGS